MSMNDSELRFRATLQDDASPKVAKLEQQLKSAGATPAEIKMFLRAYDEATPKIKEAQRSLERMPKQQIINISANTQQVHREMNTMRDEAKKPIALNFTDNLKDIMGRLRGVTSNLSLPLASALPMSIGYNFYWGLGAGSLAGAGAGVGALAKSAIGDNSQMEQSMVTLQQTMKDNTKAQQEMGRLIGIAQRTPFNYQDVLAADVRLRSYQIPAMQGEGGPHNQGWLKPAGDMAAAMNTPITQAVEAIADARQGYFVRLMDYGIRMQRQDFEKGGKFAGLTYEQGLERQIKRFAGSQEMQSKTLQGIMSNLHDFVQNQITRPLGAVPFGFIKQSASNLFDKVNTDSFQRELGTKVEDVQRGMVKFYDTMQKGKMYFSENLAQPLHEAEQAVMKFSATVGKTFGGTVLVAVKTFGEAVLQLVHPIASLLGGGAGQQITQLLALFKALQFLGLKSVSDPFLNLARSLNPLSFSLRGIMSSVIAMPAALAKLGTLVLIKQFIDARQATDQLRNSFNQLSKQEFNKLNADIMNMAHGLDMSASGMQRLVSAAAAGIPKAAHDRPAAAVEVARQAAGIRNSFGLNATQVAEQITAEMKRTGDYKPEHVSTFANNVKNAGVAAKDLGYSFSDLGRSMLEFKSQAAKMNMAGISGGPALLALQSAANAVPITHNQLQSGIYSGDTLLQQMMGAYAAPSIPMLRSLGPNKFDTLYNFRNTPILDKSNPVSLASGFADRADTYHKNQMNQAMVQGEVSRLAPTVHLPVTANPWLQRNMGADFNQITSINDPTKRANQVYEDWRKNEIQLSHVQDKVVKLTNDLNKQNATYQAYSQALDQVGIQLQQFEHTLVPIQRAIEDQQLKMQEYSFKALRPLERDLNRLNQAATEVSNTMSNAQYDMAKYSDGLLTGEQAVLDQMHGLEQYNKQLQLLQLLNQQLGAQLGSTTFERGYEAHVKPMMGLTLAMQMQKNEREQQRKQLEYDLSFGEGHYQMQQAARTANQRREMPLNDRLQGIRRNTSTIDAMTVKQHDLQNKQQDLQAKMFTVNETIADQQDQLTGLQLKLEKASASPAYRRLQDEQYGLQMAATQTNMALTQQQITIDRWNATVDDLKQQGNDLGRLFGNMINFGSNDPLNNIERAKKMVEEMMNLPSSAGGISPEQGKSFLNQLNQMEDAMNKARGRQTNLQRNWFAEIRRDFTGLFSEDTWNVIGANIKKFLGPVIGTGAAGAVGTAASVGGEAATLAVSTGIIGNLVRLAIGRIINKTLVSFGLVEGAGNAVAGVSRYVGNFLEGARLPGAKAVGAFTQRAEDFAGGKLIGGSLTEALTAPFKIISRFRELLFGGIGGTLGMTVAGPVGALGGAGIGRALAGKYNFRESGAAVVKGVDAAAEGLSKADEAFGKVAGMAKKFGSGVVKAEHLFEDIVKAAAVSNDTLFKVVSGFMDTRFAAGVRAARAGVSVAEEAARPAAMAATMGVGGGRFLRGGTEAARLTLASTGRVLKTVQDVETEAAPVAREIGKVGKFGALFTVVGSLFDLHDLLTKHGRTQRTAGGSLAGTVIGGTLGSVVPGIGTLGGAALGSLIGTAIGHWWTNIVSEVKNLVKHWPEMALGVITGPIGFIGTAIVETISHHVKDLPEKVGYILGRTIRFAFVDGPIALIKGIGKLLSAGASAAFKFIASDVGKLILKFAAGFIAIVVAPFVGAFLIISKVISQGPAALVSAAKSAVNAIGNIFVTIAKGIVNGVKSLWNTVKSAVGGFFSGIGKGLGFAGGIDYVPRDGLPATLHQGEAVLQAPEADIWRRTKRAGAFSYAPSFGGVDSGRRGLVSGSTDNNDSDYAPLITHIRKAHSQIEQLTNNHLHKLDSATQKGQKSQNEVVNHSTEYQTKAITRAAKKQTSTTKGQLDKQHSNADTGYKRTHGVISDWTKKINDKIKSTSGNLKNLNGNLGNLGKGVSSMGALPGMPHGHSGPLGGFLDAAAGARNNAHNEYKTREYLRNLSEGRLSSNYDRAEQLIGRAGGISHLDPHVRNQVQAILNETNAREFPTQARYHLDSWLHDNKMSEKRALAIANAGDPKNQLPTLIDKYLKELFPADYNRKAQQQQDNYAKQNQDKGKQNHEQRKANRDKWNKDDQNAQDDHHKIIEDGHAKHATIVEKIRQDAQDAQNKIEDSGFGKIYNTTKSWLGKVAKAVGGLDSSLGLTHGHNSAHHGGNSAAAKMTHDVGTTSGYASGGLAKADPYKIGNGRLAYLNEEGHDEMIIPLAPHRRGRALSLMKQALGMMGGQGGVHGYANGGFSKAAPGGKHLPGGIHSGKAIHGAGILTNNYALDGMLGSMRGRVPLPPGAVTVDSSSTFPSWAYGMGNTDPSQVAGLADTSSKHRIWLNSIFSPRQQEQSARHELGHIYDMLAMNNTARSRFEQIMGLTGNEPWRYIPSSDWVLGQVTPSEMFAETYRWLSDGKTPDSSAVYNAQDWLTQDRFDQVNALLHGDYGANDNTGVYSKRAAKRAAKKALKKFAGGGVSYANPLAHARGIVPERVDMGVDYAFATGSRLDAIGRAKINIAQSSGSGWPGGGYVNYTLLDGPAKGRSVFWAEDIRPTVSAGDIVKAGQKIATYVGGSSGTEIGWASGPQNQTLAAALGQQSKSGDPGEFPTAAGASFNDFITALGAPSGKISGKVRGKMPKSWSKFLSSVHGGGMNVPGVPKALQGMGLVGEKLYTLLKKKAAQYANVGGNSGSVDIGNEHGARAVFDFMRGHGFSPAQAAGFAGVFQKESNFSTSVLNHAGSGATGLAQWLGGRLAALKKHKNWRSMQGQLDFVWEELTGSERGAMSAIKRTKTPEEAARVIDATYERSDGLLSAPEYARNWFKKFAKQLAGGMRNVPYDGMPAILHKDERVLTAAENHKFKNKKSFEDMSPEEVLRQQVKILNELKDEIHKSRLHLKNIQNNTEKKAESKNLHDLNDELRNQYKAVAAARAGAATSKLAKRLGGDPSDGEMTAALVAHETVRRKNFIKDAVNKAKRSKPYRTAVAAAKKAKRRVSSAVKRAHSAHSPGGRKVTKSERRHINALRAAAKKAAAKPKRMLAQARKRGDANYVMDAAHRGVNPAILRQVRGKGMNAAQTKMYNTLVKQLQTGDKHAAATAKQLRASLLKASTTSQKAAAGRHKQNLKNAETAKKQRDATRKETGKVTKVSDKADKKREKAEKDADKREKDFYKKALDHLEKIAKKNLTVDVHNEAHGATIRTTTSSGRRSR